VSVTLRGLVVRGLVVVALGMVLGASGVLDPTHAILVTCLLLAAVLLYARRPSPPWTTWPSRTFGLRAGGRDGVSDLSWQVFDPDRRASERIVRRARDLATARLALLGVDAADPAQRGEAERLLGVGVVSGLAADERPTARTLQTWLDAIDRLSEERKL